MIKKVTRLHMVACVVDGLEARHLAIAMFARLTTVLT